MVTTKSSQANAPKARESFFSRFPNAGYQFIAAMSFILIAVEAVGMLKGDGLKLTLLFGVAILALLAPRIQNLTLGKEGIVADLAQRIDDSKSATVELDSELSQKLTELFRRMESWAPSESPVGQAGQSDAAYAAQEKALPPIKDDDDPQKGRFGGTEEHNGRRLTAIVDESATKSDWCKVTLKVLSLPNHPPLNRDVTFWLHDTFSPDKYVVRAANGEAELVLRAWGAFTVGVIADDGSTKLELDLATSTNVKAPREWRNR